MVLSAWKPHRTKVEKLLSTSLVISDRRPAALQQIPHFYFPYSPSDVVKLHRTILKNQGKVKRICGGQKSLVQSQNFSTFQSLQFFCGSV